MSAKMSQLCRNPTLEANIKYKIGKDCLGRIFSTVEPHFLILFFWCTPFGYLYFLSFQLLNEPGLGAGIDPGMALTPLPFSIEKS
jgi:hypothetical protein